MLVDDILLGAQSTLSSSSSVFDPRLPGRDYLYIELGLDVNGQYVLIALVYRRNKNSGENYAAMASF